MDDKKTRWWRIEMSSGTYTCGDTVLILRGHLRYCAEFGIDFKVSWFDTYDEAYTGWMTTEELEGPTPGDPSFQFHRSQGEVEKILRERKASRDRAVGLPDVVLDEEST